MPKDMMHLDTKETIFLENELEAIKNRTYDVKFENLLATTLFPVSTETPAGADYISYFSYTAVGMAKIISDYAHDFPRVDTYAVKKLVPVRSMGSSYGYTIKEIRRAQMAGSNLEQRRATISRRSHEELLDNIAFNGDVKSGLQGFLNYPGITSGSLAGAGAWATKTSDEIVADIRALVSAVTIPTKRRENPNTIILPIAQYELIESKRMDLNSDMTILSYVMANFKTINMIEAVSNLEGAGVSGADRMMTYVRDEEHITLEVPQAFEQFAPQEKGMEYEVPCHSETGGIIVYYPQSVAFVDGI